VKPWTLYGLTGLAFVAFGSLGVTRWQTSVPATTREPFAFGSGPSPSLDTLRAVLEEAENLTVSNDPFRLANAPASVRYDPKSDGVAAAPAAAPPVRPNLMLKAIVGGPPWQAVVDGIPGQPAGTIIRAGATFDKLIARAVTRDSVVIQGPDTTWVLSFRRRP